MLRLQYLIINYANNNIPCATDDVSDYIHIFAPDVSLKKQLQILNE